MAQLITSTQSYAPLPPLAALRNKPIIYGRVDEGLNFRGNQRAKLSRQLTLLDLDLFFTLGVICFLPMIATARIISVFCFSSRTWISLTRDS
jgi:hypothetical protein